jgi:hypothetical protein
VLRVRKILAVWRFPATWSIDPVAAIR